jgi:branched-chain amino acid transport system permease protein
VIPPSTARLSWPAIAVVAVLAALAPLVFDDFFVNVILTKALWLGVAAASLIFLAAYGGMVSLGQAGLLGIAGMTYANLVMADGGSAAAWNPWLAVVAALVIATVAGLGFGWIAARSEGIYFLMITLAFSVLVFYFFSQVTQLSGFGGVNNLDLPGILGNPESDPVPRYYVTLHRTLAFALAAFVAGVAGVLSVWYNRRISPGSINLEWTINILIIAVIGGLYRLEGAWIGALTYALIDNYSRKWVPDIGNVLGSARFNTIIGLVFLIIVLLSPGGLVGIWEDVRDRLRGRRRGGGTPTTTTTAGPEGGPAPGTVN